MTVGIECQQLFLTELSDSFRVCECEERLQMTKEMLENT